MGERERPELAGALDVPAAAEVLELTVAEVPDGRVLDLVDQLELVGLVGEDAGSSKS
jgi:hypothetical protein